MLTTLYINHYLNIQRHYSSSFHVRGPFNMPKHSDGFKGLTGPSADSENLGNGETAGNSSDMAQAHEPLLSLKGILMHLENNIYIYIIPSEMIKEATLLLLWWTCWILPWVAVFWR